MIESLIALAGAIFFAALAAEALAAFVSQAGAARSPEEEGPRSLAGRAHVIVGLLSPAVLIAHAWFVTMDQDESARGLLMAAPIAATVLGALFGSIFGAIAGGAAGAMRKAALIFALISLGLALFAAYPSIMRLAA